jgi:hypothetical protein
MPAEQPDWNVLKHHRVETIPVVPATKHPPAIEVNIYEEITGTGDQ